MLFSKNPIIQPYNSRHYYYVGETGYRGYPGDIGPQGPQGVIGPAGERGYTGLEGARGDPGQKGDRGQVGMPGLPGQQGNTVGIFKSNINFPDCFRKKSSFFDKASKIKASRFM